MPDKITLEEMLNNVSQPAFSVKRSVYKPVVESLVNFGVLQKQVLADGKKAKYEIIASLAFVSEDEGRDLLEQLMMTDLDYENIYRTGSKIIQIAKSELPLHGRNYVEIHYDFYGISTLPEFLTE
jgi:hypothetical protein